MSEIKPEQKPIPMRYCCNCGAELGRYRDYDRHDTCGKRECEREAQGWAETERYDAHEQLDRDMGY